MIPEDAELQRIHRVRREYEGIFLIRDLRDNRIREWTEAELSDFLRERVEVSANTVYIQGKLTPLGMELVSVEASRERVCMDLYFNCEVGATKHPRVFVSVPTGQEYGDLTLANVRETCGESVYELVKKHIAEKDGCCDEDEFEREYLYAPLYLGYVDTVVHPAEENESKKPAVFTFFVCDI
jgi:hypothetical protein